MRQLLQAIVSVGSAAPGAARAGRAARVAAQLVLWAGVSGLSAAAEPPALRVAVSRTLAPPFVYWQDNQPMAGIDVEITRALAAQLQLRAEFITLPRLRIDAALADGEADVACNLQALSGARRETLPQGPVAFEVQDLLLGHRSAPGVDSVEQLPVGAVLGTLQGLQYEQLDPLFASGRLKRDDALDEERLLRKLALNRHAYGVASLQTVSWFAEQDEAGTLASWRVPLGKRAYRCTLSPRGRLDVKQVSAVLERLQASGRIEQIVSGHGQARLAVVVSTGSPLRDVSRSELSELFMGQRHWLREGIHIEPVMAGGTERQQFLSAVLRRDAAQYRTAWAAQQFGGRRRPPPEIPNAEAVKQHLLRNNNAFGYLPLALVDGTLRIVYLP